MGRRYGKKGQRPAQSMKVLRQRRTDAVELINSNARLQLLEGYVFGHEYNDAIRLVDDEIRHLNAVKETIESIMDYYHGGVPASPDLSYKPRPIGEDCNE